MSKIESAKKVRVAHLVSHPIQYFAPLYRALARRPELALTVFFYSGSSLHEYFDEGFHRLIKWDVPLVGGYDYRLSSQAAKRKPPNGFDWKPDFAIMANLRRENYDAIWIHGYSAINAWMAVVFGYLTNTPVFLRDDANLLTPRSFARRALKRLILPLLLRKVIALYVGSSNRTFFEHYGARKMHMACYAVDNDRWQTANDRLKGHRQTVKMSFDITDDSPVILFCGKLIDKKGPLLLLEAFEKVRKSLRCHLLFAGEGELRDVIEKEIEGKSIPDVHLTGFLNQRELPKAYASSDLLVLPSMRDETWGLVVNEGMNFGLPVIVSNRVGCGHELVKNGMNGFIFASGNSNELVDCIKTIISSRRTIQEFGQRSRTIISEFDIGRSAQQLTDALSFGLQPFQAPRVRRFTA